MRGPPLGCPAWEGSVDERCRLAGGGDIQVDNFSATGQEGKGGEEGKKLYRSGVDG